MKLYCVRHGHAESIPNAQGERPLTDQGVEEVIKVADYLAYRGVHVSHVMHSSQLRAKQTAAILAKAVAVGHEPEASDLLECDRPVNPLVEKIQHWSDDTMLVGHMPFMPQLVAKLILNDSRYEILRFPPATIVCLEHYENYRWILNWVLSPDLI